MKAEQYTYLIYHSFLTDKQDTSFQLEHDQSTMITYC